MMQYMMVAKKTSTRTGVQNGIVAVEAMFAIAIIALVVAYTGYSIVLFSTSAREVAEERQAIYLASEMIEGVRFIRDSDWAAFDALTDGAVYSLSFSSTTISVTTTPDVTEGFYRTFVLRDAYRDPSSKDVVASTTPGAVVDSETRYVTANIVWGSASNTISFDGLFSQVDQ
jgi:type II secretory pathway pseudopilin PulG